MKNNKKILLADVNEFITCFLCRGYLVDATTIPDCLHTFCKSCIVKYLQENTTCPICEIELHQSYPLQYIAHDRTLQSIVYKLVSNLEKDELERQVKYYDEQKLEYPAQLKEKLEHNLLKEQQHKDGLNQTTNQTQTANNLHRNDEQIAIRLEPLEGLQELPRKFILCSCQSTITQLKKYVALKIYSNPDSYKKLDIVYNDEILGKDHTLKFIQATKWKDKEQPLELNFRPKLVF